MMQTPMDLIRKLDETAAALRELVKRVQAAAPEVTDDALRSEMLESATAMERRATELAAATARWRREIN